VEAGKIGVIRPYSTPDEWPYKEQTRIKYDVLSNYLTKWTFILGRARAGAKRVMYYVDCFAGPGRYSGNQDGSPIIAMRAGQKLHESFPDSFLECHFVERDPRVYESLRWEVEVAKQDFPAVWAQPYPGRFEDRIDAIFEQIPNGAPTLVFLDPYRILEIETVISLLNRRYNEILITFMSSFISRFLSDPTKESTWDATFGIGSWRELRLKMNRQGQIVRLYGEQIQNRAREELGLENVLVYPIGVRFKDRKADIYHLIHVSQHPKARLAMEQAVAKAELLQQEQASLPLFDRELEDAVLKVLPEDGSPGALELAGRVWRDQWKVSWDGDEVKQAILDLESSGYVGVRPYKNRKRKKGLQEKDRVYLRRR
jgi:three-Cys-motif partner protein